jgi:hypothetical protein
MRQFPLIPASPAAARGVPTGPGSEYGAGFGTGSVIAAFATLGAGGGADTATIEEVDTSPTVVSCGPPGCQMRTTSSRTRLYAMSPDTRRMRDPAFSSMARPPRLEQSTTRRLGRVFNRGISRRPWLEQMLISWTS